MCNIPNQSQVGKGRLEAKNAQTLSVFSCRGGGGGGGGGVGGYVPPENFEKIRCSEILFPTISVICLLRNLVVAVNIHTRPISID